MSRFVGNATTDAADPGGERSGPFKLLRPGVVCDDNTWGRNVG
jgi:hypothetical protein